MEKMEKMEKMERNIKHLVISGGGPVFIQILSAIQELEKADYLNMKNIQTIYGTSAGALIGVMLSLKFEWETINDYIIKRPWHDVFQIKPQNIFDAYTNRGIFDVKTIEKCFKPMFDAKDIPLNITMAEFYELTKIELHIFAFDVNEYKIEDISYKTYPNLSVMLAVQMTCALPVLISPVFIDNKCFMDGGVGCNYPLNFCIESGNNPDEILGFKNKYSHDKLNINKTSTLLEYLLNFLFKSVFNVNNNCIRTQPVIKHEFICDDKFLSLEIIKNAISDISFRRELFEKGKQTALQFLQNSV
jgi:predicted acylesterase/phospholipase RssA